MDNYKDTSTLIAIYEDAPPHYLIGVSTGSDAVGMYLTSNSSIPCGEDVFDDTPCTTSRVPITDLSSSPLDDVLVATFQRHSAAGYPQELLSVKPSDDVDSDVYISQSALYVRQIANIKWRILITSPGTQSTNDTIQKGSELFGAIITVAVVGFCGCTFFFVMFYRKRNERAVIYADWRFTCAFIFGCALLNASSLTLLGPNTETTCLLRMWSFHFFFDLALAPLFIKVYRMYRLVGMENIRRTTISNTQAAVWTIPIILIQVVILIISTFVDPPRPTEHIENRDGFVVESVVCESETIAMGAVRFVFEAGLVVAGCVLAYMTRNLNSDFGESKQLIFAMYNIALVGTVIVVVISLSDMDSNGNSILKAIGVFWGTLFSTAAFVLPRMVQVRHDSERERNHTRVSGVLSSDAFHPSGKEPSSRENGSQQLDAQDPISQTGLEAAIDPAISSI